MARKTLRNKSLERKSLKRSKTLRNKSFRRKSLKRKTLKRRKTLKKMRGGGLFSRTCEYHNFTGKYSKNLRTLTNWKVLSSDTRGGTTFYKIVINLYKDKNRTITDDTLSAGFSASQLKRLVKGFISDIKEKQGLEIRSENTLSYLNLHLEEMTKTYKGFMTTDKCVNRVQKIMHVCLWLENLYINSENYLFKGAEIDKDNLKTELQSLMGKGLQDLMS